MVELVPIRIAMPSDPGEFSTNPYDVIPDGELSELRGIAKSMIHIILPEGGDYTKARETLTKYLNDGTLLMREPALYMYSQERGGFRQRGVIGGFGLHDYGTGKIKRHEKTREKPLRDRVAHITATKADCGLVWLMIKSNARLKELLDEVEKSKPLFDFGKYGWENKVWEIPPGIEREIIGITGDNELYIADGHHRIASAYEYMKTKNEHGPWDYVMAYMANDDEVRVLPYNRVIRKLPMGFDDFLDRVSEHFRVVEGESEPQKGEICMFSGKWYKLIPRETGEGPVGELDVAVLQDKLLSPILGITDPRTDPNIFFIGGEMGKNELEGYASRDGNALVFSLHPTSVGEIEDVADRKLDMPPKSTWFDPKLLSGLAIYPLE